MMSVALNSYLWLIALINWLAPCFHGADVINSEID